MQQHCYASSASTPCSDSHFARDLITTGRWSRRTLVTRPGSGPQPLGRAEQSTPNVAPELQLCRSVSLAGYIISLSQVMCITLRICAPRLVPLEQVQQRRSPVVSLARPGQMLDFMLHNIRPGPGRDTTGYVAPPSPTSGLPPSGYYERTRRTPLDRRSVDDCRDLAIAVAHGVANLLELSC